jgi:hypothetical protein
MVSFSMSRARECGTNRSRGRTINRADLLVISKLLAEIGI